MSQTYRSSSELPLPSVESIRAAAKRIRGVVPITPLIPSPGLSMLLGCEVWLKLEICSPVNSFKLRGAYNALASVSGLRGAVTSSTGNHGQGVAYAARALRATADIFVPENAIETKIRKMRAFGANVHIGGADIDAAKEIAYGYCSDRQLSFIDDGDNPHVIAGAGTVGLEIVEAGNFDVVMTPMASGSLAAGVGIAVRGCQRTCQVIAVQSTGSPAMVESWQARTPICRPVDTIADCLVCRVPAVLALKGIIENVDNTALVTDELILRAVATYVALAQMLVEPGAAATLAAAWQLRETLAKKKVVLIVSGANIEPSMLSRAMSLGSLQD